MSTETLFDVFGETQPVAAPNYALRPYQSEFVTGVLTAFADVDATLAVMPTGTGKTVCFSHVAQQMMSDKGGRVLLLAHREELVRQAADKLAAITGERVAIEMGEEYSAEKTAWRAPVVCATVQTLNKRHARFDPRQFTLVIVDEAHHGTADSYRKILDYFKGVKILGVTATPDRADEIALGQVFESTAFDYELPDAIHDGWLVPIEQQRIFIEGLDLSSVRTTAGDLNAGDVEAIMRREEVIHRVVGPTLEIAGDRPTLFFASSVEHAYAMAEIANRHKPDSARAVDGTTPKDLRRSTLAAFKRGDFQFLCNCGVFLEGFDEARIAVVAMARPTKSRALYAQAVGRGTRPLPGTVDGIALAPDRCAAIRDSGKPSCLVLDFVGNSGRHKLVSAADILGGKIEDPNDETFAEEVIAAATEEVARKSARGQAANVLEEIEEQAQRITEERNRVRAKIKPKVNWRSKSVSPFDVFAITARPRSEAPGERRPTAKQIAFLERSGVDGAREMNFAQAAQLLGLMQVRRQHDLCTFKQARTLKRAGYEKAETFKFDQASAIIDVLARNNWRQTPDANQYAENWTGSRAAHDAREEAPF